MDTNLTVVEFLQEKYKQKNFKTVTDWKRANKVRLSLQSLTVVLLRGEEKGLEVMLGIAASLGCTTDELKWVAQQCGDKTLWRYISQGDLTAAEKDHMLMYRAISSEQQSLIDAMLKEMTK